MMKSLVMLAVLVIAVIYHTEALSCQPCRPGQVIQCTNPGNCHWGYVDVPCTCNQCKKCAKGPGDECGGLFDSAGVCGDGFYCKKQEIVGVHEGNIEGICRPFHHTSEEEEDPTFVEDVFDTVGDLFDF